MSHENFSTGDPGLQPIFGGSELPGTPYSPPEAGDTSPDAEGVVVQLERIVRVPKPRTNDSQQD